MIDGGKILAIVGDLFFSSKIRETAARVGVPVVFAASQKGLEEALDAGGIDLAIIDLGARSLDPIAAIRAVRASDGIRTVAFVSHVDEEAQRMAAEAGCESVLPKSAFSRDLPRILQQGRLP